MIQLVIVAMVSAFVGRSLANASLRGDLVNWSVVWTSTGPQNVAGEVTVTDAEPVADAPRFLRLHVTAP